MSQRTGRAAGEEKPMSGGEGPRWSVEAPAGTFVGVYYIRTRDSLRRTAEFIASEESAGPWAGGPSPTDLYRRSLASVLEFHELAPGEGYAAIAFPSHNLPDRGSPFAAIWLYLTAGPLFERPFAEIVRLVDVDFPDQILRAFRGPRFGISGTRSLLRVDPEQLLLGTIVKPGAGLTPEEVAARCEIVARAGVDLIKDDEKMNNPAYCGLVPRVRAVASALQRVEAETGHRTIYCAHVTARPDEMLAAGRDAVRAGATGLMVNVFASGLAALEMLTGADDLGVPVYVHSGGRSALSQPGASGIDVAVFAKFVRLLGGDFLDIYAQGGYLFSGTLDEAKRRAEALRSPWGPIAATLPACSGGLWAGNVGANYAAFGRDIIPMAGSAILAHPMGPAAGVTALRQAGESHFRGIPLAEYALDHAELAAVLRR